MLNIIEVAEEMSGGMTDRIHSALRAGVDRTEVARIAAARSMVHAIMYAAEGDMWSATVSVRSAETYLAKGI